MIQMYPSNSQQSDNINDKTSGWTPFASASESVGYRRTEYETAYLTLNAYNEANRDRIISLAVIMKSLLGNSIATDNELTQFSNLVSNLKSESKEIETLISKATSPAMRNDQDIKEELLDKIKIFRERSETFLDHYNAVSYRAHLLFAIPKDNDSTFDKTLKRQKLSLSQTYFPFGGLMITPQLEFMARTIYLRSYSNQDTILLISAERGSGKSCFALTLATVLSSMFPVQFDLANHVMFQENREKVKEILKKLPIHSTFILDQAAAQLTGRQGMKGSQIALLNEIDFSRVHGRCLIINWHSTDELDKQVRTMATGIITIPKRGVAIFKSIDNNTNNRGSNKSKDKDEIIADEDQATEAALNEPTALFKIPFRSLETTMLNLPSANKLWIDYSDLKDKAGKSDDVGSKPLAFDPNWVTNK